MKNARSSRNLPYLGMSSFLCVSSFLSIQCSQAEESSNDMKNKFDVTGIYYFGTDIPDFAKIRTAIPVKIGEKHSQEEQGGVKQLISSSVLKVSGHEPTDVAVINCGNRTWNIYVGLPGKSVTRPEYNKLPTREIELSKEALDLYDAKNQALLKMLNQKGSCREDDSKGYSLSDDPDLNAAELKIHEWALSHDDQIRSVLKNARDRSQRSVAADFLGMEDPSPSQIQALVQACTDEDAAVRNNATRALGCITHSQTPLSGNVPRASNTSNKVFYMHKQPFKSGRSRTKRVWRRAIKSGLTMSRPHWRTWKMT